MKAFIPLALVMSLILAAGCGGGSGGGVKSKKLDLPEWFPTPPSDPNYIFGTATATSKDMNLAKNKAATDARRDIAATIEVKFKSLGKRFQEEIATGDDTKYLDMYSLATKEILSTVLNGAAIEKQEFYQEGDMFRVYVMVSYPIGAASMNLANKIKQQQEMYTRFRATQAWNELDDEVKQYEEFKKEQGMP